MKYVVTIDECAASDPTPYKAWLVAIDYRPYLGRDGGRATTAEPEEAFVFKSLVAAEMAAVFVGGQVEPLGDAAGDSPDANSINQDPSRATVHE